MSFKSQETKRIKAIMILEAIGKPPEYLTETLNNIVKEIEKEKGVEVVEKKIIEPVVMKNNEKFYTAFAEVEISIDEILYLAILMFKYMPSHIEIIEPELIVLTNNGWNDVLNELTRRLHGYDEIARMMQVEKGILEKKLREILGEGKEKEKKIKKK